ncbi:Hypothetical predicted protein, partial [Paramuricea clavata]
LFDFHHFADDSNLFYENEDLLDLESNINQELMHVDHIAKKMKRGIGILSKLRHFLNIKILVNLFTPHPLKSNHGARISGKIDTNIEIVKALKPVTCLERNNDSDESKLQLLIQHCHDEGYCVAKKTLTENFGKPHIIARAHIKQLVNLPSMKKCDGPSLLEFARHLESTNRTLKGMGPEYVSDLDHVNTLKELNRNLPMFMKARWTEEAGKINERNSTPRFEDFLNFIKKKAALMNNEFGDDLTSGDIDVMEVEKKEKDIPQKSAGAGQQPSHGEISGEDKVIAGTGTGESRVCLGVIAVKVRAKNGDSYVETYALLDSGSEVTLCQEELTKKLQFYGKKMNFTLSGMTGSQKVESQLVDIAVESMDGTTVVELENVRTVKDIPISKDCIPRKQDLRKWPHLQNIDLSEAQRDKVILIIGLKEIPQLFLPLEYKVGETSEPIAVRYSLGWTIMGSPTDIESMFHQDRHASLQSFVQWEFIHEETRSLAKETGIRTKLIQGDFFTNFRKKGNEDDDSEQLMIS